MKNAHRVATKSASGEEMGREACRVNAAKAQERLLKGRSK